MERTPIGTRVELIQDVDDYPMATVKAGAIGTLVDIDADGSYWVELDEWLPALDDCDNQLQIPDYSAANNGKFHPETFFTAIGVVVTC